MRAKSRSKGSSHRQPHSQTRTARLLNDTKHALRPHCHTSNHPLGAHKTDPPTPPDPTGGFTLALVHFRSLAALTWYPAAQALGVASNNKKRKERGGSGGHSAQEVVRDPAAPRPPPARTPEDCASAAMALIPPPQAPQAPPPPPPPPPPGGSRAWLGPGKRPASRTRLGQWAPEGRG